MGGWGVHLRLPALFAILLTGQHRDENRAATLAPLAAAGADVPDRLDQPELLPQTGVLL